MHFRKLFVYWINSIKSYSANIAIVVLNYCSSFYGYAEPLSFKTIDEAAIKDMELFIRAELMELIEKKCNRNNWHDHTIAL